MKTLICTTDPKADPTTTIVQLDGIPADRSLTPALADQAARIAFGHRDGVTVTDPLTGASYRLYVNSARKLR